MKEGNKQEKEIQLLENLYPDDREVDIVDMFMDNLQLAHNIKNKTEKEIKQKHQINLSQDNDSKIHMKSDTKDYFKHLDEFRMKQNMNYLNCRKNILDPRSSNNSNLPKRIKYYRQPDEYIKKMKIENYKYYWEKPVLKQMLEGVINLAEEDHKVDIDNTKEKTAVPFLNRETTKVDKIKEKIKIETPRSSIISLGRVSEYPQNPELGEKLPKFANFLKMMNFDEEKYHKENVKFSNSPSKRYGFRDKDAQIAEDLQRYSFTNVQYIPPAATSAFTNANIYAIAGVPVLRPSVELAVSPSQLQKSATKIYISKDVDLPSTPESYFTEEKDGREMMEERGTKHNKQERTEVVADKLLWNHELGTIVVDHGSEGVERVFKEEIGGLKDEFRYIKNELRNNQDEQWFEKEFFYEEKAKKADKWGNAKEFIQEGRTEARRKYQQFLTNQSKANVLKDVKINNILDRKLMNKSMKIHNDTFKLTRSDL